MSQCYRENVIMPCCGADMSILQTFMNEVMWHKPSKDDKNKKGKFKCQVLFGDKYMENLCKVYSTCYIITELFFYINHFLLIIFYHSVWLGFELSGS